MRFLGYVCVFAVLGGALVSCSDDDDAETPGPGEATGGAADAGAPATTGGSTPTTGGRPATTGGVAVNGGEAGAESTTGGANDGGTNSATGGAGEAGDASAPGGSGGSGEVFPSSCGKILGFSECDPVSGFPCDVDAGETCDFLNMLGGYSCFPAPNDAVFCGGCDAELDQFCGAGTTCNFDYLRCENYCCDDSDCESGTCQRNPFGLEEDDEAALVGVCAEEAEALCTSGEGGASSSGGAGGASSEDSGGSGGAG
jgi:hypothetical protein